jgi:hypothetical protein
MAPCTAPYASGPVAAATSQITSRTAQTLRIVPVIRLRMDRTDVSCGR